MSLVYSSRYRVSARIRGNVTVNRKTAHERTPRIQPPPQRRRVDFAHLPPRLQRFFVSCPRALRIAGCHANLPRPLQRVRRLPFLAVAPIQAQSLFQLLGSLRQLALKVERLAQSIERVGHAARI